MPRITSTNREDIQRAFDEQHRTVYEVERRGRGKKTPLAPTYFILPDHDTVIDAPDGALAWDRATGKIVRFSGGSWADVT